MADYDRRPRRGGGGGGGGGHFNNRKRRYRGMTTNAGPRSQRFRCSDRFTDDDFDDRRPQRRRYEEPLAVTVRKQVLAIAESVRLSSTF